MRRFFAIVFVVLFVSPQVVEAGAIISIDMDPLTAGIQSSTTVTVGSLFTIDVVVSDDGMTPSTTIFDTILLDVSYNDAGVVLGAGPAGHLGGALAGNHPGVTIDLFGMPAPVYSMTGAPLMADPAIPSPGFADSAGAVGLFDPLLFTVASGPPVSAFSFEFTALTAGTSTVFAAGSPPGSPALAFGGQPVAAQLISGSVTVQPDPSVIPEPGSMTLLGIGAACLTVFANRRKMGMLQHSK